MRTLFINKEYPPSRGATGRVLSEIQASLQSLGETADVLYDPKSKIRVFSLLKLLFRALSISKKDYDCVVLMTDPPFLLIIAPFMRAKGIKVIYWCQDLYPELFSVFGYPYLNSMSIRLFKKHLLKSVDKVIVIGRDMKEVIMQNYNIREDKISVIYNWADKSIKQIKTKKEKFIVMYSGNCGKAYDFNKILEVASILQKEENIIFKFVCSGKQKIQIEKKSKTLPNILITDYVLDEEYNKSINSASLHFISTKKETKGLMVPCKSYSALAAGIPIIYSGNENSEIALLIKEYNCGFYSDNSQELANYIIKLYKEPKFIKKYGNNALKINLNFGALEAAKQFKKVVNK